MKYDILVIGGVAAGTKVAAKAKREDPDLKVAIVTKDQNISYAGCGLPYYIGGIIEGQQELIVKTPAALQADFGIDVFIRHEAKEIIPEEHSILAMDMETGQGKIFEYNKLIIATGAFPILPPLPGIDLDNIFTVRHVEDAVNIREAITKEQVHNVVVIGGGFIGLEVAENLKHQQLHVTVVEAAPHILPNFDQDVALHLENYLREEGIDIFTEERVTGFVGDSNVTALQTTNRTLPADAVILAIGVRPNVALAKAAGISLGLTGAIAVNNSMETNLPDIFAVGDCAESVNAITGLSIWAPMGSTANKAGRTVGINVVHSNQDQVAGVLGTMIIKLFSMSAAKTGLSERDAQAGGYDYETVLVPANDKAHYYPGYRAIITKLIADRPSRRILGVQIWGEGNIDKPIDIFVTAISFGATVDAVAKLDLAYAPPFSMAMSSSIVAANVMRNKLDGKFKGISPLSLDSRRAALSSDFILDIRTEPEFIIGSIPEAINIPLQRTPNPRPRTADRQNHLPCLQDRKTSLSYVICTEKN